MQRTLTVVSWLSLPALSPVYAEDLTFCFPGPKFAAGDGPQAMASADLDGDAIPDLVTANPSGDEVSVLRASARSRPRACGCPGRPVGFSWHMRCSSRVRASASIDDDGSCTQHGPALPAPRGGTAED